jgi:hypothetical protein
MPAPFERQVNVADVASRLLTQNDIANNLFGKNKTPLSPRDDFMRFLSKWETSIPLQSLWMVIFDIPHAVNDQMMKAYGEFVYGPNKSWSVDTAKKTLSPWYLADGGKRMGCAFATSINIPGETVETGHLGYDNRGFLRDPILNYRSPLQPLSIDFLETHISFTEHILRPWMILTSHRGFAANNPQAPLNNETFGGMASNITIIQFARAGTDMDLNNRGEKGKGDINEKGLIPRKVWMFKDCVPVKIDPQGGQYGIDNDLPTRSIEWLYRRYQVNFPEEDIKRMFNEGRDAGKEEPQKVKSHHEHADPGPDIRPVSPAPGGMGEKIHWDGDEDRFKHSNRNSKYQKSRQFFTGEGGKVKTTNDIKKIYKAYDSKPQKEEWDKSAGENKGGVDISKDTSLQPKTQMANKNSKSKIVALKDVYENVQGTKRDSATGEDDYGTSKDYQNVSPFAKEGASPQTILDSMDASHEEQYHSGEQIWDSGTAGAAGVQKTLKGLGYMGYGSSEDPAIQDGQYSNMANKKDPKKIAGGSGIFGLLGL